MIGVIFITISIIGYFLILNSKVKNKGAILLGKFITALLSALLLSLLFAYMGYTPIEEQEVNIDYFSFRGLFGIYFMYSLPVFLICGGLYSFFADMYLKKLQFHNILIKYTIGLLVYLIGGLLIVGLFIGILLILYGSINGLLISDILKVSALPSLLFYHIYLFYKKTLKLVK